MIHFRPVRTEKISSFLKEKQGYFFYLTFLCFYLILTAVAAILSPQANNIRTKQYTCAEGGKAEKWRETGFLVMSLTWEPPYHRALCYVKQEMFLVV